MFDATAKLELPAHNFLLAALPPEDQSFVRPHLQPVELSAGTLYADYGQQIEHCYFPDSGMISLLSVTEAGNTCEVGYIGSEGIVGMSIVFGRAEMPYQALVQAHSVGNLVAANVVAELFARSRTFHDTSLKFTSLVLRQFAQTSACNRFHSVHSRLCRWFSIMCERSGNNTLTLTQEFLAYMLGVQRTSIGSIAQTLQDDGVIRYSRGKIQVIDIDRLNAYSCECRTLINAEIEHFLSQNKSLHMSTTRQTRRS